MKILIDIGHPAHVHYFKNLAKIFIAKGHKILFTTRNKEVAISLLEYYAFDFISFGKPYKTKIGKVWGLFWFTLRLFIIALKYKPDVYLNATMYSAIVAWILRKPHISLEDTFNMEQVRLYLPFTNVILTGNYPHTYLGSKEIRYNGYQELAYLHPKRFTPNHDIYDLLGLGENEKYVLLRFVSWNASHDIGQKGIDHVEALKIVKELSQRAKVFISSEGKLSDELKPCQIKIPPHKIHDALAFATLYIGEGATMASECAMLGTPSIYVNTLNAGTIDEQEKFGLLFSYRNSCGVLEKAIELLDMKDLKKTFQSSQQRMLSEKIDVTAFMVWFVENYPSSFKIMKKNSDYQLIFK